MNEELLRFFIAYEKVKVVAFAMCPNKAHGSNKMNPRGFSRVFWKVVGGM